MNIDHRLTMISKTDSEDKKIGFKGLSLGKSSAVKKLQPGVLHEEQKEEIDTDFITGVSGKEIESEGGKKTKPEEIIIPMKPNDLFKGLKRLKDESVKNGQEFDSKRRKTEKSKVEIENQGQGEGRNKGEGRDKGQNQGDLESTAISELIEAAERENEEWEDRGSEAPKNLTIPGQTNRQKSDIPSDEDSDQEETDYEKVPISAFGVAMLRGMGWKEGEGIGKNKQVVDPIQAVARPKGLGLGADRSALQCRNNVRARESNKDKEELELKPGSYCQITQGSHEDMYGEILSTDMENSRVYVKLALGGDINLSEFKIRLVSKNEYNKYSKYINKSKTDRYKEEELKRKEESTSKRDRKRDDERERTKDSDYKSETDKKYEDRSKSDKNSEDKSRSDKKSEVWIRAQIRVRIIDKKFNKGKYFKEKVTIDSLIDKYRCMCRTEDKYRLLEIDQHQLETVIPKDTKYVMVVLGKYRGRLGEILEKDKKRCRAVVQLLNDRDIVKELDYSYISEYTGDIHSEMDF